jgi:hypothetical protein
MCLHLFNFVSAFVSIAALPRILRIWQRQRHMSSDETMNICGELVDALSRNEFCATHQAKTRLQVPRKELPRKTPQELRN